MTTLGVISEKIFSGITPKSGGEAYAQSDDGILFIKSGCLSDSGIINFDESSKIKAEIHNGIMKASKLKKNDVLIAIVGATIGKVGLYHDDREANINQAIAGIRLKNQNILPKFIISYLLSSLGQTYLEYLKRPVARANINLQEIAEIEIPVVAKEKQIQLVSFMDNAISNRNRQRAKANELLSNQSSILLQHLNINIGKHISPLCSAVSLMCIIKDKTLNADYYHSERLNAINSMKNNSLFRLSRLIDVVDFCRSIVNSSDVNERYLGLSGVESQTGELTDFEEDASGQAFTYQSNDVLYGRLRPYLNKVYFAEQSGICSTEFHVMRVKNKNDLLPEYLAEVMRSDLILSQTKHMMTGNTHPRISNDDVKNLYIPIPDILLQQQIIKVIRNRRTEARKLKIEAEKEWQKAKKQFEKELLGE